MLQCCNLAKVVTREVADNGSNRNTHPSSGNSAQMLYAVCSRDAEIKLSRLSSYSQGSLLGLILAAVGQWAPDWVTVCSVQLLCVLSDQVIKTTNSHTVHS